MSPFTPATNGHSSRIGETNCHRNVQQSVHSIRDEFQFLSSVTTWDKLTFMAGVKGTRHHVYWPMEELCCYVCFRPNSHRTQDAMQCEQMGPVVINGSICTACEQHQRKNVLICVRVAWRVLCELGLRSRKWGRLMESVVSSPLLTLSLWKDYGAFYAA